MKIDRIRDELCNYTILFSTILLYLNSRVDANFFKLIYVFLFIIVISLKLKSDFKIPQGVLIFGFFVTCNVIFLSDYYLANIATLIYFLIIFLLYYFYTIRNDFIGIVNSYIGFAFIVSMIGLMQEVLYLIDPEWLFYLSKNKNPDFWKFPGIDILRIASLLDEPSKLGMYILPALLLGFGKFYFENVTICITRFQLLVIFIAFILTFSAHAYLSFIISMLIILLFLNQSDLFKKYTFLFGFILVLPFVLSHDAVTEKLINTGVFSGEFDSSTSTSATSAIFYIGSRCVGDILTNLNFFGIGMGNYNTLAAVEWSKIGAIVDNDDGSTIGYARIIVEFGIIGIVLFSAFAYSSLIKFQRSLEDPELVSIAFVNRVVFLFVIVNLFRMGFYINPPMIFFVSLLLASKIKYRQIAQRKYNENITHNELLSRGYGVSRKLVAIFSKRIRT